MSLLILIIKMTILIKKKIDIQPKMNSIIHLNQKSHKQTRNYVQIFHRFICKQKSDSTLFDLLACRTFQDISYH